MAIDRTARSTRRRRGNYLAASIRHRLRRGPRRQGRRRGGYAALCLRVGPNGKLYGAPRAPLADRIDIDAQAGTVPRWSCGTSDGLPGGLPVQDVHAGTFGKDGKFYYPLNTTGPLVQAASRRPICG